MKKLLIVSFCMMLFVVAYGQNETGVSYKKRGKKTFSSYTPNGNFLAISKKRKLSLYKYNSSYVDKEIKAKRKVKAFKFNPDNSIVVVYGKGFFKKDIAVWNAESLQLKNRFKLGKGSIVDMTLVNDSTLAFVDTKKHLKVLDLKSGKYSLDTLLSKRPLRAIASTPDEGIIVAGGADKNLYVLNLSSGAIEKLQGPKNWIRSIDVFTDGRKIVCGSDDQSIYYYDLDDKSKNINYSAHKNWVRDVKFAPDGNFIASIGDDRVCAFYDLRTKGVSFKFKQAPYNSKISIHPSGKDFTLNSEEKRRVYVRDLSALNIIPYVKLKDKTDKLPPQIYISQPARIDDGKAVVFNYLIPVKGTAMDESGLRDVKVNGKAIKVKENGNFTINIPLSMGDNPVTIEAIDINDNVAVKKFIIVRKAESGEELDTTVARNHLLVIGINEYTEWPKLSNAVRDARSVANILTQKYGFDSLHSVVLLDSMATKQNIEKSLRNLISKVSSSDNLIIYYAGHGHFDPILNEGYWVPVDAANESQYFSNTILLKYLANINSRHTFLVVDACFSGSLFASRNRGYVDNVEKFRSRWGLTSGRLETVADGAYGANSPFATNFVKYLETNQKDEFPVSDIVQFVKVQVANSNKQTPIGSALRDVGDEGGEMVFKLKK